MAGICDAVDYAHRRGMIHRDIKPANIMLTNQGEAVLMDFGVVKMLGSTQHTATGAVIGTALYMSPEQARGEHPSERSDIYSLGVTLFEMVSGRPPFEADSALTAMMMHLNDPVPNVLELNHETPQALKAVIEKALAKDPADRYQSAGAMADALRGVLAQLRGTAPRATIVEEPSYEAEAPGSTVLEDPLGVEAEPGGTWMDQPGFDTASRPAPSSTRPSSSTGPQRRQPQTRTTASLARKGLPLLAIVGGAGLLFAVVAAVIVGALLLRGGGLLAGGTPPVGGDASNGSAGDTGGEEGEAAVAFEPTATPIPTDAPTQAPTNTPPPTETPTPAYTPTPTVPYGVPYVRIDSITLDGNVYTVTYETFEYEPALPGMHIHFFFDTVSVDNAGVPGQGPWYLYGGPNPFMGYTTADRPQGATQMCALVANPDHSIQRDSGNCVDLPN
jgi:hypothetical protein